MYKILVNKITYHLECFSYIKKHHCFDNVSIKEIISHKINRWINIKTIVYWINWWSNWQCGHDGKLLNKNQLIMPTQILFCYGSLMVSNFIYYFIFYFLEFPILLSTHFFFGKLIFYLSSFCRKMTSNNNAARSWGKFQQNNFNQWWAVLPNMRNQLMIETTLH